MGEPAIVPFPKSKRVEFIDLLRGWAVLVMIETHVFNATLTAEAFGGDAFQWIKFINGLVAPSFLFASGLAYAVTTRRKLRDYLSLGPSLYSNVRRLLFVVMIGYLLHIPKFNFKQLLYESSEQGWQMFFQADVLQCIGVSLLCIQGLLLVLKDERRLYYTLAVLAVIIIFVTPIMWGMDAWHSLPFALAGYMNANSFSGFPLFPWAAFLFGGAVFGYFYLRAKDASAVPGSVYNETKMMEQVLLIAPLIIALSFLIEPLASSVYPVYDYWMFSPSFFFLRFGIVMLLCAGMFFYEKWKSVSPKSVVALVGRESLIVYSVHLLLIYGNFATFNFRRTVNHSFGYQEALTTTIVLVALMIALAFGWDKVRKMDPSVKKWIQWSVVVFLVLLFFFGPGQ